MAKKKTDARPEDETYPVSGPLRSVIARRDLSAYSLAKVAGIDVAASTRFIKGKGLTLASVDKIAVALGLRLIESGRPPLMPVKRRKRKVGPTPGQNQADPDPEAE